MVLELRPFCLFTYKFSLIKTFVHFRGISWTFVDIRALSWNFVDIRVFSWTFVDFRGQKNPPNFSDGFSLISRLVAIHFRGLSRTFVDDLCFCCFFSCWSFFCSCFCVFCCFSGCCFCSFLC